jgi:acyl dehydratase
LAESGLITGLRRIAVPDSLRPIGTGATEGWIPRPHSEAGPISNPPRIIRKLTGNFLEDFEPGQRFRHEVGKTLTGGLFTTFTELATTATPRTKNARYASAHDFDSLVCPPGLAMLIAFSQTLEDVSENARANLEYIHLTPDGDPRRDEPGALQPVHHRPRPQAVRGRPADHLRRHPFHSLPEPLVAGRGRRCPRRCRLCDGPPRRPLFAGDTVCASSLVRGTKDRPSRPDLGLPEITLYGHEFVRDEGAREEDAPGGWKKVQIFELERESAIERRSHYAGQAPLRVLPGARLTASRRRAVADRSEKV